VLHAGPAEIGALAALGYLPAALFGLYAGAWADRLSRRRIMITADIARFAALATVPVTYLLGVLALGQLYAVAFCIGTLSVFFDTASPAYLPALVARAELARANGRLQISEQGAAGIRRRQAAAASEYNRRTTWRPSALAATMTRPVSPPRRPRVAGYHGRDVRACPARQRPGCDDRRSRAHRDQKREMLTMPLHDRDTIREQFDGCVFADRDLTRPVAKYRFPQEGTLPRDAFQLVSDELMLDGNARQNLATFCQTWEEPEVLALMALAVNKNMIDRDEYPQTAEIERRCVHMMADLWNAPEAANTVGT